VGKRVSCAIPEAIILHLHENSGHSYALLFHWDSSWKLQREKLVHGNQYWLLKSMNVLTVRWVHKSRKKKKETYEAAGN